MTEEQVERLIEQMERIADALSDLVMDEVGFRAESECCVPDEIPFIVTLLRDAAKKVKP